MEEEKDDEEEKEEKVVEEKEAASGSRKTSQKKHQITDVQTLGGGGGERWGEEEVGKGGGQSGRRPQQRKGREEEKKKVRGSVRRWVRRRKVSGLGSRSHGCESRRAAPPNPQLPHPPAPPGGRRALGWADWRRVGGGAGVEVSVMGAQGVRAPPPQVKLLKRTFKVDVQQPIRG